MDVVEEGEHGRFIASRGDHGADAARRGRTRARGGPARGRRAVADPALRGARDAPALFGLGADPAVTRFFSWGPYTRLEQSEAYIDGLPAKRERGELLDFVVVHRRGGPIGVTGLSELARRDRRATVGSWFGHRWWGSGRNYESKALIAALGLRARSAWSGSTASANVLQRPLPGRARARSASAARACCARGTATATGPRRGGVRHAPRRVGALAAAPGGRDRAGHPAGRLQGRLSRAGRVAAAGRLPARCNRPCKGWHGAAKSGYISGRSPESCR